ncbi:MAG: sulfatase-like hydrolase/transferase [Anaerolineales bacterium]|nr:sulfatase-like hydrolase/transferase [Anaerolineales bacterium]
MPVALIRVWIAYFLFNLGLLLPGVLFMAEPAVRVQLNAEVALAFTLWSVWGASWDKRRRRWFTAGFGLFYVFALIYKSYAAALAGLYQLQPNFFNDYSFVLGGVSFLLEGLNLAAWAYLAGVSALVVLIGLIFWGARATFEAGPVAALGKTTRLGLIALGLTATLGAAIFPGKTAALQLPVSSITAEISANLRRSLASQDDLGDFMSMDPAGTYDYSQYDLSERPDVLFIFVESYGSVLYQRPHFTPPYLEMMAALETSLAGDGWAAVSALSEAPTWGGGSWMSYTSALFGVKVDQQSEYDALKEKYSVLEYPNIGRYFSSQGYQYVWVVPIDRRLSARREAIDQRFYGADRWVTFETLEYEGPLFGWGPSPPDQFTLGYIQESVLRLEQPTFLMYLTQNSHYPWTPLPPVLDDWRALEDLDIQDGVLSEAQKLGLSVAESRQNYLQAIDNTFASLEAFITTLENENTVIVLIGDHQPPTVSRPDDGYGTMVHIISQDTDLLASFHEYGFVDGLVLENLELAIRHEGLYSLFVRNFVAQYGQSPWSLPPYLPDGQP